MTSETFQSALEKKLKELNEDRDQRIRDRVARLVFGASIVRVFKSGTKKELIPYLAKIRVDEFKNLKSERCFKQWFQKKSGNIAKIIKGNARGKVNKNAHASKILALYCRALLTECWDLLDKNEYKRIEQLLFVPIDSYVIKALRELSGFVECEALKDIKSMADFGPKTFMDIQEMLKSASDNTGIPRIVFDYVWGEQIKSGQRKKQKKCER